MSDKELEILAILYALGAVIEDKQDWTAAGLMQERLLDLIAPRTATPLNDAIGPHDWRAGSRRYAAN